MHEFDQILFTATAKITVPYMQLPVAAMEDPIYRERVYCYELYHQMRCLWPPDSRYSLGGEIDKKSHPLIRGNGLDNVKPDLLVHEPGDMGGNYAVIEVKPISTGRAGIRKDLRTLTAFRRHGEYARAIFLVYGDIVDVETIVKAVRQIAAQDEGETIDLDSIELWSHERAGLPSTRVA